jgi:subtilisin family serine protease
LNPNQVTEGHLKEITVLDRNRVKTVLRGRPYYSLEELAAATALPRTVLSNLFTLTPMHYEDKRASKKVMLEPVFGRYVIPAWGEFEEDGMKKTGYVEVFPATKDFRFRIVQPSSFLEPKPPHLLKAAYNGNVHPVLRDSEGFERFLVPGSIDLWFKRQIPLERRRAIIQELGLQVTEAVELVGYYRVKLSTPPDDLDLTRAVLTLVNEAQKRDEIIFAEPDQVGFEDFGPEVSVATEEEDMEAAGLFWNQEAIELAGAHAINKGSSDVTVFIIDSGCRMDHEELQAAFPPDWQNLDLNFDLEVPASELSPHEEAISHGTKVSGVVKQIAPGCTILPIKISGKPVTPAYGLRAAAILQALTYLGPGKRAVINLSWRTNGEHIGIREALKEAASKGVAIAASAGNYPAGEKQTPNEFHYPSGHARPDLDPTRRITGLCSVAAVGVGDGKCSYSYYGNESVTVAAPGGEGGETGTAIYTSSTPEKHAYVSGTSFSSPHVAALIALLFSEKPDLSVEEAIQIIRDTANSVDDTNPGYAGMLGAGRINARRALEKVKSPAVKTYTIAAISDENGIILPGNAVTVQDGSNQEFTIRPDQGYNVKEVLVDGQSIGVVESYTFRNVTASHTIEARFESKEEGRLNINKASASQLTTLPFIGPWLANRIVEYREQNGPYRSVWELALAWVNPWVIGQIEPFITV